MLGPMQVKRPRECKCAGVALQARWPILRGGLVL
jgi:hypothetical protein